MSDAAELKPWRFQPGQSGNPGGRAKNAPEFRKKCRHFCDAHVFAAWTKEVLERGEKWLEASKLLAAYGYGLPKEAPATEDEAPPAEPTPEEAQAAAERLRARAH